VGLVWGFGLLFVNFASFAFRALYFFCVAAFNLISIECWMCGHSLFQTLARNSCSFKIC
jgi:hypothetical protein